MTRAKFAVVDLFSGAGGMSLGFHRHPAFEIVAAADAELGKPSAGRGRLQCNDTYYRNIGVRPAALDLSQIEAPSLRRALGLSRDRHVSVLAACPPCTGFSRANPTNHLRDDARNSLVRRSAEFAVALGVDVLVMENARELVRGNFDHHYRWLREHLENAGFAVFGANYLLTRFGLPQVRERAIVVAARRPRLLRTLDDLWRGWSVREEATTVGRALASIPAGAGGADRFPSFASDAVRARIAAIPRDGGSWIDLVGRRDASRLLTPAMQRLVAQRRFGSYPDIYGRMSTTKPAPTIKRECAHVGNGRYAHPFEDRLCSVREIATLQGFPSDFVLEGAALSNLYRHLGDAVPPLVSYQLAHLCHWMLTRKKPDVHDLVLARTHLRPRDLRSSRTHSPT